MLAKLHRLHAAAVKEKIKSLDVQPGHLPFLIVLLDSETPMIQEEIAARVLIDKSVAARGIDCLEKKGFLCRCVNPDNRRQKLVEATVMAKDIKKELFDALRESSDDLLKALTREEQDKIMALLDRMLSCALDE